MFYYNGQFYENDTISFNINDSAWLYGANIFTTMRVYNQSLNHPLTNWQKHCDRILNSIVKLEWREPNWQRIEIEVKQLLKEFTIIRITIFPDGRELITGRKLAIDLEQKQQRGVKGIVCLNPLINRSIPHHKTGNYLASWVALQQAQKQDYQEAILINSQQHWLETTTGNLWGYKEGIWFTPDLAEGILPGIARQTIIEKANFPIKINQWNQEFIKDLEAVCYSNSVVEIIPFSSINIDKLITNYTVNNSIYLSIKSIFS